ncbi:F510_1955 family glycosylhydrolase [Streptomyces sp. JJ36]|uniref:F510_1955 family glycosylhydrolase n=1 Tax=Streptomyces sp. JJ36 TaxID=2736645 RepID=UPI001F17A79E|nr:exo-alpha-sialidase [Streptomyces sp. JJ36]MCF6522843.1 exo-alpha-sialidase [Streptomyces sp. JJ36]
MNTRQRAVPGALALLAAVGLTACSAGSGGTADGDAGRTSRAPAEPSPGGTEGSPATGDPVDAGHIHGLGVDPADGRLYVATHRGVLSVGRNGEAQRVGDAADYMGFAVAGPGTFLGSGHPAPGSDAPANRGLIRSTDAGRTWQPVSLSGEVDFHALSHAHGTVYGYDSTNGVLRVSRDGKKWDARAQLAAVDITVSPDDPDVVLATTRGGLARSTDGGRTFGAGRQPLLAFVSWAGQRGLYGLGPDGVLRRSSDGGRSWEVTGRVPGGAPQALTAVSADRVLAATGDGVYESRDGGATFTRRLAVASGGDGH